jgi:hypothetical protein
MKLRLAPKERRGQRKHLEHREAAQVAASSTPGSMPISGGIFRELSTETKKPETLIAARSSSPIGPSRL